MFNKTAEIFVRKNGLPGIERLRRLANQGASLADIADAFHVSVATAGRLKQTLLKQVFYVSDATVDWLRYCEQRHAWIADQHRQSVENGRDTSSNVFVLQQNVENR